MQLGSPKTQDWVKYGEIAWSLQVTSEHFFASHNCSGHGRSPTIRVPQRNGEGLIWFHQLRPWWSMPISGTLGMVTGCWKSPTTGAGAVSPICLECGWKNGLKVGMLFEMTGEFHLLFARCTCSVDWEIIPMTLGVTRMSMVAATATCKLSRCCIRRSNQGTTSN